MLIKVIWNIYEEAYAEYSSRIYILVIFSFFIFDIIDRPLDFFFFLLSSYSKTLTGISSIYLLVWCLYLFLCLFIFYDFSYYPYVVCQICIFFFQSPLVFFKMSIQFDLAIALWMYLLLATLPFSLSLLQYSL